MSTIGGPAVPAFVTKTQMTLGNVISKPKLTASLLVKPPFIFLHAILCEVVLTTGFGRGLYTAEELNSKLVLVRRIARVLALATLASHQALPRAAPASHHPSCDPCCIHSLPSRKQHRPVRMLYLAKMLALVNAALGQSCALRIDKAIDGAEPRKTNDFLQLLAFACQAPHILNGLAALVPKAISEAPALVAQALAEEAAELKARAAAAAEAESAAAHERGRAPAADADGATDFGSAASANGAADTAAEPQFGGRPAPVRHSRARGTAVPGRSNGSSHAGAPAAASARASVGGGTGAAHHGSASAAGARPPAGSAARAAASGAHARGSEGQGAGGHTPRGAHSGGSGGPGGATGGPGARSAAGGAGSRAPTSAASGASDGSGAGASGGSGRSSAASGSGSSGGGAGGRAHRGAEQTAESDIPDSDSDSRANNSYDSYARRAPVRPPEPARPPDLARPLRAQSMPASAALRAAAAASEPRDDGSWACARCCARNEAHLPYCEVCATIRRRATDSLSAASASEPAAMRRTQSCAAGGPSADPHGAAVHRTDSETWWTPTAASGGGSRAQSDDDGNERGGSPARAGGRAPSSAGGARAGAGDAGPGAAPAGRRPSRQGGGAARSVEEMFGDDDGASQQAGWYERKLHRQWSSHQQRERSREEAEEVRRARDSAAEEARQARGAALRGAEAAARHGDARGHEARWAAFVSDVPAKIRYSDIPWLPIESADLLAEALGLGSATADPAARKKAHRAASMRWHPDRFTQQFGAALLEDDYERVMARVTATSQALNTMVR